jgi:hypothetical protein
MQPAWAAAGAMNPGKACSNRLTQTA